MKYGWGQFVFLISFNLYFIYYKFCIFCEYLDVSVFIFSHFLYFYIHIYLLKAPLLYQHQKFYHAVLLQLLTIVSLLYMAAISQLLTNIQCFIKKIKIYSSHFRWKLIWSLGFLTFNKVVKNTLYKRGSTFIVLLMFIWTLEQVKVILWSDL